MEDTIFPRLRSITADLKTYAGGITKSGLRTVEVRSSGHWGSCVDALSIDKKKGALRLLCVS